MVAPPKGPLRILKNRKIGGAASALAMRHPSPRTITSFVSNMSNSNLAEEQTTRIISDKVAVITEQQKRIQLKRGSEYNADHTGEKKNGKSTPKVSKNELLRALLNSTNPKSFLKRPVSQAGDITQVKPPNHPEQPTSTKHQQLRVASPSPKLNETKPETKPLKEFKKIVSAASSPKGGQQALSPHIESLFSPSKCKSKAFTL